MDESWLPQAMEALRRSVALAGGQGNLPGLTQQTVSYRLRKGIPLRTAEEVLAVEAETRVSRHDLRPDMFPRNKCLDPDCPEHSVYPREGAPSATAGRGPSDGRPSGGSARGSHSLEALS